MGNFLGIPGTDWLGAGVSLVNGYLDRKATQQANEQNIAAQKWITNFQAQHDIDMFNMENAYNTPLEQLKRMTEAGINPASAFSNGSASPVAASGQSSVSGAMPTISPVPSFLGASIGTFANLTNIAKAIGETKKLGIDTRRLEQMLPLELEGAQYENDIKKWQVEVGNTLQGKRISAETENLIQRTNNLMAEAALIQKRGILLDDEHDLNMLEKTIKDLNACAIRLSNDKATQELAWLPKFLASSLDNLKADTSNKKASAFESYASGNKSIAETKTIDELREGLKTDLTLRNALSGFEVVFQNWYNAEHGESGWSYRKFDSFVSSGQLAANLGNAVRAGVLSEKQSKLLEEQAKKAVKDGDWNAFGTAMGAIASGMLALKTAGLLAVP